MELTHEEIEAKLQELRDMDTEKAKREELQTHLRSIADSGERREFSTGAVRDIGDGKGRCDLIPLLTLGELMGDDILSCIGIFVIRGHSCWLRRAFLNFADNEYPNVQTAILELSKHYEEGAKKYQERNWEAGLPLHCFIDSAVRHYLKYTRGDKDEPHDRAFLWNILGAMWTQENHPELCDLPYYNKEKTE